MRTAIMGAGSLGTVLGAYISKAGRQIDLIDSNEEHVKALNEKGAAIVGQVNFTAPVRALTPDQMQGAYDLIIYLVKQTANDKALAKLREHLNENSTVCTLQNGMPEYFLMKALGEHRVVGGVVGWGANLLGPGISKLDSAETDLAFDIGETDGRETKRIGEVRELLELMCRANILDNLMGVRWNKLIANAAMSGMSAVLGCTFGDILDNPEYLLRAKFIANECIQVCRASGVRMAVRHGYDHGNLLYFETASEMRAKDWIFRTIWEPHRNLKASMLQDLEKGRKCEVEYINGVVCEIGAKYGVPAPVNQQVVTIIKEIEAGRAKSAPANITMVKVPEF